MEAAQTYICALYHQPSGTSMENARFKLFTKKKKTTKIMALPPMSANLLLHVLRAHLQVMLWKAADQQHHLTSHQILPTSDGLSKMIFQFLDFLIMQN